MQVLVPATGRLYSEPVETGDREPAGQPPGADLLAEQALIEQAGRGDSAAFASLVARWSPTLLRTAMVVSGRPDDVEDAVTRAWMRTVPELAAAWSPPRFVAWMCRLLLEEILGGDPRRLPAAPIEPAMDPGRFHPPQHYRFPGDWTAPPVDWPDGSEGHRPAVWDALALLPQWQRIVLALRDTAGCSIAEIADMLGDPPERVRRALNAARAGVRNSIELQVRTPAPL